MELETLGPWRCSSDSRTVSSLLDGAGRMFFREHPLGTLGGSILQSKDIVDSQLWEKTWRGGPCVLWAVSAVLMYGPEMIGLRWPQVSQLDIYPWAQETLLLQHTRLSLFVLWAWTSSVKTTTFCPSSYKDSLDLGPSGKSPVVYIFVAWRSTSVNKFMDVISFLCSFGS